MSEFREAERRDAVIARPGSGEMAFVQPGAGSPPPRETATTRLEAFSHALSDDLCAPLSVIADSLDLIARRHAEGLDASAQQLLTVAQGNAERLQTMIEGLADVALVNRRLQLRPRVVLGNLVKAATEANGSAIAATGAMIQSQPLPELSCDPRQMTMVFNELIANALRFARPGCAPVVTLRAIRKHRQVVLVVSDNGIGVPSPQLDRIFDPFFRCHNDVGIPGVGLGLTRCREIIEAHQGFIYAYPNQRPDHGITMICGLPA